MWVELKHRAHVHVEAQSRFCLGRGSGVAASKVAPQRGPAVCRIAPLCRRQSRGHRRRRAVLFLQASSRRLPIRDGRFSGRRNRTGRDRGGTGRVDTDEHHDASHDRHGCGPARRPGGRAGHTGRRASRRPGAVAPPPSREAGTPGHTPVPRRRGRASPRKPGTTRRPGPTSQRWQWPQPLPRTADVWFSSRQIRRPTRGNLQKPESVHNPVRPRVFLRAGGLVRGSKTWIARCPAGSRWGHTIILGIPFEKNRLEAIRWVLTVPQPVEILFLPYLLRSGPGLSRCGSEGVRSAPGRGNGMAQPFRVNTLARMISLVFQSRAMVMARGRSTRRMMIQKPRL